MAIVETKTQRCPCCKYEYQVTKYFKDELKKEKIQEEITKGTKPFDVLSINSDALARLNGHYIFGNILGMFCPECGTFMSYEKCTNIKLETQTEKK